MTDQDLFAPAQSRELPFVDIRNQRDSVAEQKAVCLKELGELLRRVPVSVRNGSVQDVRQWKRDREESAKVAKNQRSSVNELSSAINRMKKWGAA